MNHTLHKIPTALQYQVLTRAILAAVSLFFAALIPFFLTGSAAIPFLLAALLLDINAGYIYWAAISNRVLELKGIVLTLERTALQQRPKALLVEIEGKALRIVLHSRRNEPKPGDQITLFILDNTHLYSWRGLHQINNYLTLVVNDPIARY